METTVDNAQKNSVASNDEVVAATAQANRINLIMAIVVILSLLGSMCSPSSVAAASEEASTNVQSVASATEELSSSISEIGRQMQHRRGWRPTPSARPAAPTTASANCRRP